MEVRNSQIEVWFTAHNQKYHTGWISKIYDKGLLVDVKRNVEEYDELEEAEKLKTVLKAIPSIEVAS